MDLKALEKTFKDAKKAYKADKDNKDLKKAFKAAKKAFNEAKEAAEKEPAKEEPKTETVDVEALAKAAKDAKKAWKADKENKDLKKAWKAAKKAHEDAKAAAEESTESVSGKKRNRDESEEDTKEAETKEDGDGFVVRDNSKKAKTNDLEGTPNPKVFCGNLSFDIDDDQIKEFFKESGEPTDIYWLTDRDSGKFKGCGFITFASTDAAIKACQKNGEDLLGRPIKVNFAKPRPGGDRAKTPKKGGFVSKELSAKPEGCVTVFCGNLSFDIDDDAMTNFAKECGEISRIRWLTDKSTGDFKGCGFIDFTTTEAVDEFVKKNGEHLMGRPIRIDYAKARPPKQY